MRSMQDDPPIDKLLSILRGPGSCDGFVCTTCGGWLVFRGQLDQAFPDRSELVRQLAALAGDYKVWFEKEESPALRRIVESLDDHEIDVVLGAWLNSFHHSPDQALSLLRMKPANREWPRNIVVALLAHIEPLLLSSRALRNEFRVWLEIENAASATLRAIYKDDAREDTEWAERARLEAAERAERERLAAEARRSHFARISALPFPQRIDALLSDTAIDLREWRDEWVETSSSSLAALSASALQRLIDHLNQDPSHRWDDALRTIYEFRHEARLAAMQAIRLRLGDLPPEQVLLSLIKDRTTPIEIYPGELAPYATRNWFALLEADDKRHFEELVSKTRLRFWRRVFHQLAESHPPPPPN